MFVRQVMRALDVVTATVWASAMASGSRGGGDASAEARVPSGSTVAPTAGWVCSARAGRIFAFGAWSGGTGLAEASGGARGATTNWGAAVGRFRAGDRWSFGS